MSQDRKVWVVTMPMGVLVEPGSQIMIEQFGDAPPAIAFRGGPWATWGPPQQSEAR